MAGRQGRAEMPCIIRLCDGFSLQLPNAVSLALKNRKAAALLGYLALKPNHSETRELLAELFWGDSGEKLARDSLRQAILQIRKAACAAGIELIRADNEKVFYATLPIEVDILSAYDDLAMGTIPAALSEGSVAPERLLYGYEDLASAFDNWLQVTREKWRGLFVQRLEGLVGSGLSSDRRAQAAQALLALDSTHEVAVREFIRHRAETGNPGSALKAFDTFKTKLSDEYGVEPDQETLDLVGAVQTGMAARGTIDRDSAPKVQTKPVIFLEDLDVSVGEAGRYVATGLRHMLLASLTRFRHWIVIDSSYTPQAAAGLAGDHFAYILQIAALDAGDRTGLNVKLLEAKTKRSILGQYFYVDRDDWPVLAEAIVRKLAAESNHYLSADSMQRAHNGERGNVVAFDRWMKGVFLLDKFEPDAEAEAERNFRDVTVMSPDFGPAYASLAGIYNSRHIVFPGIRRNREREDYALSLAQKAVELEPLDARCQVTLGWSFALSRRFRPAEIAFDLAEDLNSSDPALLMSAAHGTAICGNVGVAQQRAARAMQTHPHASHFFHAILSHIHFLSGDYRQSLISAEKGGEFLTPLFGWKAAAHAFLGEIEEAQASGKRLVAAARRTWRGTGAPDQTAITEWFLDIFPFASEAKREKLEEGLALAGLPLLREGVAPRQRQKPRV